MAEIVVDGVTKEFAPGGAPAVDDVSLTIGDGEFLVLVGPSGCGKTTLLRIVAGLETASSGRILLGSRDITNVAPKNRDLAMVFQNYALYPHMTVFDNLAYALRVRKTSKPEVAKRVGDVATLLGLDGLLERRPAALSGGQRQRVAMGRAIVREPAAFMMDEPLSNLDAKLRVSMRGSLAQLHARLRTTTIYVTHDQTEAMTLGERVAVMRDGRVQQVDTPQKLYRTPENLFVAAFIGSPAMNLIRGTLTSDSVRLAGIDVPLPHGRRPAPSTGNEVVVGIRPEHLADGAMAETSLPRLRVHVDVVEDLGADRNVVFGLDVPPVRVDGAGAAEPEDELLLDRRTVFTARLDGRSEVRPGDTVEIALDPAHVHFFDPADGRALAAAA